MNINRTTLRLALLWRDTVREITGSWSLISMKVHASLNDMPNSDPGRLLILQFTQDDALSTTLHFGTPLTTTITEWPNHATEVQCNLIKSQKALHSFGWDTSPVVGAARSLSGRASWTSSVIWSTIPAGSGVPRVRSGNTDYFSTLYHRLSSSQYEWPT